MLFLYLKNAEIMFSEMFVFLCVLFFFFVFKNRFSIAPRFNSKPRSWKILPLRPSKIFVFYDELSQDTVFESSGFYLKDVVL